MNNIVDKDGYFEEQLEVIENTEEIPWYDIEITEQETQLNKENLLKKKFVILNHK